jgi:hypothetical protein
VVVIKKNIRGLERRDFRISSLSLCTYSFGYTGNKKNSNRIPLAKNMNLTAWSVRTLKRQGAVFTLTKVLRDKPDSLYSSPGDEIYREYSPISSTMPSLWAAVFPETIESDGRYLNENSFPHFSFCGNGLHRFSEGLQPRT